MVHFVSPLLRGTVVKELVYPRTFLPSVERDGKRPYIVDGSYTATLEQHAERVLRLTSALKKELRVSPGD